MKLAYICLLIFSVMYCSAQKNSYVQKIKGNCFEGYIFSKEYSGFIPIEKVLDRFTPLEEDVMKAEDILNEQIINLNNNLLNQTSNCPIIHKKLSKYKRQYFGIVNENGDRVIWINFLWGKDKEALKQWNEDVIIILDGCSYYWNVKVNLTKDKLFDLYVNGSS